MRTFPVASQRSARFPPLVLLVDDSLDQLDLYEFALADRFAVLTASRGDAAVALAIAEQPDAIVVDLSMPGMDGWEVSRRLKHHPRTMDIPIIMLTASDGTGLDEQAARLHVTDVLHKPCAVDVLRDRLRAVTGESRPDAR